MKDNCILFIGGSNYDITGKILDETIPNDSNPSIIYGGAGGVGRNIAINTSNLGINTSFISAFGDDLFSEELIKSCEKANIDISNSFRFKNTGSAKYLSILDNKGELVMASCDLKILEDIPESEFIKKKEYINSFPYLFLDTNLTKKQLIAISSVYNGKIFMDAVSIKKAERLIDILDKIDTLKVNILELGAISKMEICNNFDIKNAALSLINKGLKRLFVTMGKNGSICLTKDEILSFDALKVDPVNVTGAGDSYMSGIIYGTIKGYSNLDILKIGTTLSKITLLSPYAVDPNLNEELLLKSM